MIELFCKGMPKDLSNQMYNEYYSRLKEVKYIIQARELYVPLAEYYRTIELILALYIFNKRVIVNFNAATMFATKIFRNSNATAVRIGTYDLDENERRRMIAITMQYKKIMRAYEIPKSIFEYIETKDLLREIRQMKIRQDKKEDKKNSDGESI